MSERGATFRRVYCSVATLLVAALACLPFLVSLSFAVLGFDPRLRSADTAESYDAYRASAPLRRGFTYGVVVLALLVLALSAVALVPSRRRRFGISWMVLAVMTLVAVSGAVIATAALLAPTGMCC